MLVGGYVFIEKALEKIKQTQPPSHLGASLGFRLGPGLLTHQMHRCRRAFPGSEHHLPAGPLGWVTSFAPIFTAEQILDHLILLGAGPPVLQRVALHRSRMLLLQHIIWPCAFLLSFFCTTGSSVYKIPNDPVSFYTFPVLLFK